MTIWKKNNRPETKRDQLRISRDYLHNLTLELREGKNKVADDIISEKDIKLTTEEELLLLAVESLMKSYSKTDTRLTVKANHSTERTNRIQAELQLKKVTEERDTLSEKIKEDQITSGLFIQSVRDKFNWLSKEDKGG